jgi:TPR repeat protein
MSPNREEWSFRMKRSFAAIFLFLLFATPAGAGCDDGLAAYVRNDLSTAMKELLPLAEKGDAKSQYVLARVYFRSNQNYEGAVKWYKKAAEQGHAASLYFLSGMYWEGRGVPQDNDKAMKLHLQATQRGYAVAQNHLGFMYDFGRNIPQNYSKAMRWYSRAAEQGHAIAQYSLGGMYRAGKGIMQDYVIAHKWYDLAALYGNELAGSERDKLARSMTNGQIVEAKKLASTWVAKRRSGTPSY